MDLNAAETAYRVLARKYRPQNFSDLIGQEPMIRTLTNAFDMGRIAQAWMLTGVRGVGKTTTARILARALNYKTDIVDRPTVRLEELGEHCRAIMESRHVDVVEMDAASHTGIDDIREIIEQVRYRPVSARYKVYIIDEVHMLSTQAFNGLLKTLEEPPPHAKFIFATTEIRKVPITVLSRCQRFDLRRVGSALLARHLQKIVTAEGMEAETAALAMIARAGEGSVRDCLSLLDQAIAHSGKADKAADKTKIAAETVRSMLGLADKTQIIDLFRLLMRGKAAEALAQLQHLYAYGAEPSVIIQELLDFNHLITRLRFQPALADDISLVEEERKEAALFSGKLSVRILSRNWQMLLKGLSEVENAARPLAAAEMLLIRLCHAADLPNLDEALQLLEQNKQGNAPIILAMQPSSEALPPAELIADRQAAADRPPQTPPHTGAAPQIANAAAEPEQQIAQQPEAIAAPTPTAPVLQGNPAQHNADMRESSRHDCRTVSLRQLVAMAEKHPDPKLKIYLREYLRPAPLPADNMENSEQYIFRFVPDHNAPPDIARQIGDLLLAETGKRWNVQAVETGGGATLKEEEEQQKENLMADARNNTDVAAILRNFPGAKLVDVQLTRQDEILPEADAVTIGGDNADTEN